jgi:hypothetical protein
LNPKYVPAYIIRGVIYTSFLSQFKKGIADFTRAIELNSKLSGYFSDIDPQNGHANPLVGFISKN